MQLTFSAGHRQRGRRERVNDAGEKTKERRKLRRKTEPHTDPVVKQSDERETKVKE